MFKSPFSFKGRIRRLEYGLSVLIYSVIAILFQVILVFNAAGSSSGVGGASIVFLLILLPCLYFMLAQGVKRSHDLGNSGWFVLIPFYGLWLIFADGEKMPNKYGDNPKGIGNHNFSFDNPQ